MALLVWQGWSCGLVDCPGGNATDPIWRVLTSSNGISFWTPLKPQLSNPNPFVNQFWCIDFFTPPTPRIIHHRFPAFLESLMPLKNWCSIHARWLKSSLKHSIRFFGIFLKQNFIAYRSSKMSDCLFEIHQQWQSDFSRVYSNCCCSCSFKPEIINIGLSSHKIYSNNILKFQESATILNACTKKGLETYWSTTYEETFKERLSRDWFDEKKKHVHLAFWKVNSKNTATKCLPEKPENINFDETAHTFEKFRCKSYSFSYALPMSKPYKKDQDHFFGDMQSLLMDNMKYLNFMK